MSSLVFKNTNAASVASPIVGKTTIFVDEIGQLSLKDSNGNVELFPGGNIGSNTQVLFNDEGNLAGNSNFTWNKTSNTLTVTGNIAASNANLGNTVTGNYFTGVLTQASQPNITGVGTLQSLLVGATSATGDYGNAKTISSQDNSGVTASDNIGLVGEAVANSANTSTTGIGLLGVARANSATKGTGVQGEGHVTNTGDTGAAVGIRGYAIDTHAGGYNIGVLGNAMGSGVGNYAFYVQAGGIGSIETATFWDLADNSNISLTFNSTGKANIFGIDTTDASEGIFTSGYLSVTGNATVGGIKTNNYYYSNGSPVDFQQTGGSNTQVQFNDADSFGGSAAFTFNKTTNTVSISNALSVTGNTTSGNFIGIFANGNSNISIPAANGNINISAGGTTNELVITTTGINVAGTLNATGNANVGNLGTAGLITATGNVSGGNLTTAGALSVTGNANVGNLGTVTAIITTGNITTINSGLLQNGNSNVTITANANVTINAVGGTRITATSTGANVTGTLGVSGNANVGNLGTAQVLASANITAPQLISNIATGTAPLVVTSTTQVANLNVASAGAATNAAALLQNTSTSTTVYPTFTTSSANGNSQAVFNTSISANLSNASITATTFVGALSGAATTAGTVTTAAQGNITSVGTLTSLTVSGNTSVGNLIGPVANGNSNVSIPAANGNVNITAVGNTTLVITGTGANITGTLNATGNANVGNLGATGVTATTLGGTLTTASQPNITSVGTLSSLSVTANVAAGNLTTTGVLSVTGTGVSSIAGNLDMTSNNIINLATPVNANDAATKQYVDDVAQGLHTHDTCNAATTDTLAVLSGGTVTYNNGSSGVGATLTTTGSYTTIDGVTLTNGMRILVKNEANSAHNGIYDRTSSTILTRSTDFDTPTEMAGGDFTFVTSGTLYDNTGWVMTDAVTTVGTSPVPWVQFSGAGTYTAGTGLTLTGTQFSITNTAVTAGSYGNGDAVATFTVNGQGQLTAASNVSITANAGNLSGTTLKSTVVTSSLTSVGNVTTGTWNSLVGASATFAAGLSGANLASITGGNVSGTVGSATNAAALLQNTSTSTTVYPTFTTSSANGNSQAVFNTSISANLGNASITATTFVGALSGAATTAGTVTTNAQPNITSVGTLTSLGVSGTVTASTLVSNVADGTAPLTVTSTTRVANLNVAYANVADNINVTAPGTGTGYIVFANATTGNVAEWTTAGISSNLANNSITATTFVGALSGAATTAGTVTTNAQPNITSVGTLSSVAVTGNANVGNLNSSGRVYANDNILIGSTTAEGGQIIIGWVGVNNFTGQANSTWNIDVDSSNNYRVFYQNASGGTGVAITAYSANANIATNSILSNGTIGGASATLFGTTLTTGANTTAGTITGNWALSAGSRFNATYADLAERYSADADYKPGTVVVFGGNAEVTITPESDSHRVAGVVSTNPAYLMNSECEGEFIVDLALMGRVPVQVLGPISKGDLIVTSEIAGYGKANNLARAGTIVGKALENLSQSEGVIEVLVGRT